MKLGTLLSAALGAVSLLGSAVGCYVAVSKYSTMADVNEARTRLQVARIVGQIVPLVASERGYATNIIFAPTPAEMPSRAGLDKLRAITDAAHSRMLEGRRELLGGLSDATAIAQSIDALDAQFKLLRSDMDRAFVLSSDARKEAGQKVNRENVRLNKIASDLVNEQIRLLAPLHGYAYRLANFAGIAIALRGVGGNYSSFAKNYIALERPATIEQKLTFAGISAHSALLSASLMELRDVPGTPANVIAALDQFKASYVTRFGDVVKRVAAEAETGKYSIGLETFYGESQPALKTIVAVRDALYENAEAALAATYSKARTGFLLALAGLIFTLAISAAAMLVVVRGVSRPIMQLTQRMSSLAGGDLDRAIPHMGRADEVGEMAGALVVFRDAAREKIRLEHAAEEARIAAEQERLRTQAEAIRTERELVVRAFGAGMARLAEKDLSFRLEDQVPEAYATLQSNFNRAVDALEAALLSVAESSRTIAGGTGEISGAATDLARRTESQAASLEQTAAAIDEITNTGRKAAEGAAQARDVVRAAKTDAEKTGLVVRETVAAIGNIEKSSDQISRIISVIDEIAFQTNLLALNAGVEAARAGEAGRGFAVVASEVRGLAQRSAEAAKEIKGLVTASSAHVAHGVELVAATGKALERILVQVNDINEVVGTIASGAETQASGLGQINTAITQMDQNTQQNAAMVEETTAASCTLEQQARHLRDLISAFSLRGSPVLADAPRTRRRAA